MFTLQRRFFPNPKGKGMILILRRLLKRAAKMAPFKGNGHSFW